ncbi:nickel-dependent lactate racemase family protein [Desulfocicer niacini]
MATIHMPYDGNELNFDLPDHQLGEIVVPNAQLPTADIKELMERTLSHPTDSPPLEALAKPGQTVAVIIDDISRPTPTAEILPPILNRLLDAGVLKKDIYIVIALGSHRPLTPQELIIKTGDVIAHEYTIINTSCQDTSKMLFIGKSSNGIPAEINQIVVDADLRIGIGGIGPHMDTGFSGGGKILLPGVCSDRTVDAFHAASADVPGNQLGNPEAPTRHRMETFVREQIPLHFIVNAILHPHGGIYQCVAGHFITAHRKGVEYARQLYGVAVKKRYPVVIANSYPFEIDFWQCTKAFWAGDLMASDKGLVVMVSPCPEGTATHPLWARYLEWEPDELEKMFKRGEASDRNACAFAIMFNQLRKRVRFGVITPTIPGEIIQKMGLLHFQSIEQAIELSVPRQMTHTVAVITHGGVTVPQVMV